MPEIEKIRRVDDLDNFAPSPPEQRIDDKAAALEAELSERKAHFNKERFCYYFCIIALFNILMCAGFSSGVFAFSIIASVLFLIGIGKWLDFPFIHDRLDKWDRLLFGAAERWLTGKPRIDTEPM